jgi:hypothetical protein
MLYDDIDRNDPDLRDPLICRHRAGDPECMCHPEEEEVEPEIDPDEQLDRDLVFAFGWIKQLRDGIPPEVTEEQVADEDVRLDLNDLRTDVLAIIEAFREDWLAGVEG